MKYIRKIASKTLKTARLSVVGISVTAMCALPLGAYADLNTTMENVLNGLANTTSGGYYSAANRGVISGGSLSARTKIFNANIVSMTLPEFSGGCGGIDMFGGSFSFINMQQFIQLMRAIAANSIGLLFQVAIEYISPTLANLLRNFLTWIQRLNALLSNSCRLAKGIIAEGADAIRSTGVMSERLSGAFSRVVGDKGISDEFTSWYATNPFEESESIPKNEQVKKGLIGNAVWEGLKAAGQGTFVGSLTGNTWNATYMEQLMSLTGTVIITQPDTSSGSESAVPNINRIPASLQLQVFVEGYKDASGNHQKKGAVWSCDEKDYCLDPTGPNDYTPNPTFKEYIEEMFCGDDVTTCTGGILAKYAGDIGEDDLTSSEKAIVVNLPKNVGRYLKGLAATSRGNTGTTGSARAYIQDNSTAIAAYLAYHMLEEAIRGVKQSLASARGQQGFHEADLFLTENLEDLKRQYDAYVAESGSLESLEIKAKELMESQINQIQASDMFKKAFSAR